MKINNNFIVQFFYKKNFINFFNKKISSYKFNSVLDIGSGSGFLKPIFEGKGKEYLGIEPDDNVFLSCTKLYGSDNFINDFFPSCFNGKNLKFDLVIILTCLDEVPNKIEFLEGLFKVINNDSTCFIVVRNKSFFINYIKFSFFKSYLNGRSKISLNDLSFSEWKVLFEENNFLILDDGKYLRPWITGFNLSGFKNILYNIFSIFLKKDLVYMNYFTIKKN